MVSQTVIREAKKEDVPEIMDIRMSVRENILSDPSKVTAADCHEYLFKRGKGWVSITNNVLSGFIILDLQDCNLWALFLLPAYEKNGIGFQLHQTMLEWAKQKDLQEIWLSTDPGTRAEGFYRKLGWKDIGLLPNGERKFIYQFSLSN